MTVLFTELFGIDKKVARNKHIFEPLLVQPSAEEVVTFGRYYAQLDTNTEYRKRITWLTTSPDVAVVEYVNQHAPAKPHGNSKNQDAAPYRRTPAETMDAIAESVLTTKPRAVYTDLVTTMDVDTAPRNSRSVHDINYRLKRQRKNPGNTTETEYRSTFADEILAVIRLQNTDRFVRSVQILSDHVPSVILFCDRQIQDIPNLCVDETGGSVLGCDKTFNIGSVHVTVLNYVNPVLRRVSTGDSPIFVGPVFLHGTSDFLTFNTFFSLIASNLQDCDFNQLRLGGDDEQAMRKAMAFSFKGAALLHCTRHLKVGNLYNSR